MVTTDMCAYASPCTAGVLSMIPMRVTSTPWQALFTPAVGVADTGTAVIGMDARLIFSILTQTLCAQKIGAAQ